LQTNKYVNGGDSFGNVEDQFIADLPPNDTNGTIKIIVNSDTREMTVSYTGHSHILPLKYSISNPGTFIISAILPDPVGSDRINESVTLQNKSSVDIQLDNYRLIDDSGRLWLLTGVLEPNETVEVLRNLCR
jgi:hypothetical protein